jgi:uncharacterized phage-associated protein
MIFDEEKAAQAAAYLLHLAGGRLQQTKLMKLLYLAERLSYQLYGFGLTGDGLLAVDQGPILNRVQSLMDGAVLARRGGWDTWIQATWAHDVTLRDQSMVRDPDEDLLALSESDIHVLSQVWELHGRRDALTLVEETKLLPEVTATGEGVIDTASLLSAVGFDSAQVAVLVEHLSQQREIGRQFA